MLSIGFQAFLIFSILHRPSNRVDCLVADDRPVIQPILVPPNLVEKRKVLLNCQTVQGRPPISFEWQFNGKKIVPNENVFATKSDEDLSILTIRSLSFNSIGNYTCIAKNDDLNLFDSNTVKIEFNCKSLGGFRALRSSCSRLFRHGTGSFSRIFSLRQISLTCI